MKIVLLTLLSAGFIFAQTGQPNCQYNYSLTNRTTENPDGITVIQVSGGTARTPAINNRNGNWCNSWYMSASVNGFSAVSLSLQDSQNTYTPQGGTPTAWVDFEGTVNTGTNPSAAITSSSLNVTGYYPWMSVRLASSTGTGSIDITLYGWRTPSLLAGTGSGTVGPQGPPGVAVLSTGTLVTTSRALNCTTDNLTTVPISGAAIVLTFPTGCTASNTAFIIDVIGTSNVTGRFSTNSQTWSNPGTGSTSSADVTMLTASGFPSNRYVFMLDSTGTNWLTSGPQAASGASLSATNVFTGRQDMTGAASTATMKTGTSLPGTCIVGDVYFKSDATAGQNIYECQSTNTWTQQLNSGSSSGTAPTIVATPVAGDYLADSATNTAPACPISCTNITTVETGFTTTWATAAAIANNKSARLTLGFDVASTAGPTVLAKLKACPTANYSAGGTCGVTAAVLWSSQASQIVTTAGVISPGFYTFMISGCGSGCLSTSVTGTQTMKNFTASTQTVNNVTNIPTTGTTFYMTITFASVANNNWVGLGQSTFEPIGW